MVQINFAQKQVNAKIVYYGPGMSGKTTNLEVIHQRAPEDNRGDLTSISTEGDRTLFFDFMPLDLGTVAGMRTCFQIYTVPGQVYYNSTRKLVLQGVDGVIFVADSSPNMMEENLESLRNLAENLEEYGRSIEDMPLVIQYNKRDMPGALPIEELEEKLNTVGAPAFEAIANTGQGVFPTLKAVAACVLESLHKQQGSGGEGASSEAPPTPQPSAPLPSPEPQSQPQAATPPPAPAPQPAAPTPSPAAPSPAEPVAQHPATGRPTISMSQTGFHKAPSLPLGQTAPSSSTPQPQPPTPAPSAPEPAPQGAGGGGGGLQMRQPVAPAPQPAAQPAPSPAPQQRAMPQAQQTMAAPQAAPPQATPSSMMGAPEAPAAAPQRRVPTSRSFPTTPSSGSARPTPRKKKGKSALVTGIIVVASVGIGAVLGSVLLSFL